MADEINKKINIEVGISTETATQNINSLNTVIDGLLDKQKKLTESGQQNTSAFSAVAAQLEKFQSKLKDLNTQLINSAASLNTLSASGKTLENTFASSAAQHQKIAEATSNTTGKTKELSSELNALDQVVKQQNGTLAESKTSFNAHKVTMDHLKKSFDEIKDVSGIFGPSLQEASKGFSAMKSGLALVKDGFTGVGAAIKADGFDFLLEVLQLMFNYFIKTSKGSAMLKGAISAIGVVVKKVQGIFHSFVDGIVNAFSHPIESLKALGKTIEQNLINRFRAFAVIIDGIIHLDFKKVTNGAVQAFTGVTNATDKIGTAFTAVKNGVQQTAGEMVKAYEKGYKESGKHVDAHLDKVRSSIAEESKLLDKLHRKIGETHSKENNDINTPGYRDKTPLESVTPKSNLGDDSIGNKPLQNIDSKIPEIIKQEQQKTDIKKTALQQYEDYAKQSGARLATEAIKTLDDSIKQQAAAKVAALEKNKASELSNKNLTSVQKLAIEQKYQKQEGAIKAKAFKEEQELSIAQAIINGAEAVTKVSAQAGVLAPLEIGVVIAETAAQVAKIDAQKPPAYAKGGLHYASDGRGGVLAGYSRTDNTNAYLRSGEGIVVSEAMQVPWARNLVSAINVGFGGRDFSVTNPGRGYAVGGIFTDGGDANRYYNQPVNDQKNLANTIAYQMINNFPPVYVDVKDINNQQNILAQTINRVNL